MRHINIVAPDFVSQHWNKIKPFFEASFKFSTDDYTVDQIKFLLVNGQQICLVAVEDDGNVIGASAVSISNYPNHRVLHITSMGGRALVEDDLIQQFEAWARSQGVTKIRAFAQDAQARLYKIKMGFESVAHVVEKNI
jgi:hypothetical protein